MKTKFRDLKKGKCYRKDETYLRIICRDKLDEFTVDSITGFPGHSEIWVNTDLLECCVGDDLFEEITPQEYLAKLDETKQNILELYNRI